MILRALKMDDMLAFDLGMIGKLMALLWAVVSFAAQQRLTVGKNLSDLVVLEGKEFLPWLIASSIGTAEIKVFDRAQDIAALRMLLALYG